MKTEQKQRLFALYWGQTVLSFKDKGKLKFEINAPNMWGKGINNQSDNAFLLLTHPNNITDEHCVELFDLLNKGIEKDYSVSEKVYDIKDLTNFYDVPIEGKVLKENSISFGDIVKAVFTGKNASLRLKDDDTLEIVEYDMDEEGNELTTQSWKKSSRKKMLLKGLVRRILDALKEASEDNYEILDKQYKEDPEYVFENITDYLA